MLAGNQNMQGLGIAADKSLPPIRFAFGHFIIKPTIRAAPTYFNLLAAPRAGRGRFLLRVVNPFNQLITLTPFGSRRRRVLRHAQAWPQPDHLNQQSPVTAPHPECIKDCKHLPDQANSVRMEFSERTLFIISLLSRA